MFTARRGFLPGEDAIWIDQVRRHLDELHVRALEAYAAAGLGLGGTELPPPATPDGCSSSSPRFARAATAC